MRVLTETVHEVRRKINEIESQKEFYKWYSIHCEHVVMHAHDPSHDPDCATKNYSFVVLSAYAMARRTSLLVADWAILQGQLLEAIRLVENMPDETQAFGPARGEDYLLALLNSLANRRTTIGSSDK